VRTLSKEQEEKKNLQSFSLLCFLFVGIMSLLDSILEVERPIGMNLIVSSFIPWLRSFGPTPWSSSEGFLGTFTPGVWRILFFPLDFLSEYTSKSSFHFDFRDRALITRGFTFPSAGRPPNSVIPNNVYEGLHKLEVFAYPAFEKARPKTCESNSYVYLGEVRGIDLMNPRLPGILEPLNPTDEALKEGRNTKNRGFKVETLEPPVLINQLLRFGRRERPKYLQI
jgi:hypothetical protein